MFLFFRQFINSTKKQNDVAANEPENSILIHTYNSSSSLLYFITNVSRKSSNLKRSIIIIYSYLYKMYC